MGPLILLPGVSWMLTVAVILLPGVNWVLTVAVILLLGVSLTPGFVARCELDIGWLWFCCQM